MKRKIFSALLVLVALSLSLVTVVPPAHAAAALTHVSDIGTAQNQTWPTAGTTLAVTTTAAVAAGDDIIVTFAMDDATGTVSVADSAGNTYTSVADVTNTGDVRTLIFAAYHVTALSSGSTITITHPSVMARAAGVSVFRGLAPSGALDQTKTGTGTGTTPSSGATANTTQADELLIGAVGTEGPDGDNAGTWQDSFTAGPRLGTNGGGPSDSNITASMGYKIVSATGAYTASKSGITSRDWAAAIATFKRDNTAPTVTINQAAAQSDPTRASPINFTVVFSERASGFATGDVTLSGTAGANTAIVSEIAPPNDGTTYNVAVSGMTASGTVTATIAAGVATDVAGNDNMDSTSTDNTVTYGIPGITVTPTAGLVTTEAGDTDTFTIVLNDQPTADVTIGLMSDNTAEGTLSTDNVTFTPLNWDTEQPVTITGVDDYFDDGDIAYSIVTAAATSTDLSYDGINPADVSVTNTDNDTIGITVSAISDNTTEAGGNAFFTIVLDTIPSDNVSIGLMSSDLTEGILSTDNVTFTTGNWSTPQPVTVTGVDDYVDDGDIAYSIVTAQAVSADTNYSVINPADVSVTNTDDDTAGVTVSAISRHTYEPGGTATFTIVLNTQPAADVSISLSSDDTTEGTVSPASVTFTPANWNTPQTITVTGVDDTAVDSNIAYTIVTAPATSADPNYSVINPADVSVINEDNDINYSPGGGGGGGGGEAEVVPTTTMLDINMLGSISKVQVTNDGITLNSSMVISSKSEVTLELARGTRIISGENKVPMGLALTVAKESPPIPEGMVLVSQVYDCIAYSYGKGLLPVMFNPPATLVINYNPEAVPENISSLFIAYYDAKLGWVPLDAPSGFVAEAGAEAAQVSHFTPFAVLARLTPLSPASFEVSNLDISPGQVETGAEVIISAQIANIGGMSGEYTLMVNVDGLLETSQVVELVPGQSQEVSFTLTPDTPGSYQVEIGGLQASFVVVAPPLPPSAEAGEFKLFTPWSISVIAIMVLAALALILVRKRRQPAVVIRKPLLLATPTAVEEQPWKPAPTAAEKQPPKPVPTAAEEQPRKSVPVLLSIRDLRIIPNRVQPGGTVYVFAEVTNNNPTTSSFSLVLKVKGVAEALKQITLGPGQSQKVVFIILKDKPGVYDVELNGLKGSFSVEV